jgi:hypothetical protein
LPPHRVNEIEEDFLANPITVTVETFKQLTLRQLQRKYNPESPEVEEKRGCTTEKKITFFLNLYKRETWVGGDRTEPK